MGSDPERTFSAPEREYIMETYDVMLGTFKEYAEMIIQVSCCTYIHTPRCPIYERPSTDSSIMSDYSISVVSSPFHGDTYGWTR